MSTTLFQAFHSGFIRKSFSRLDKHQRRSLWICGLFIAGMLIGGYSNRFLRYSQYREFYTIGAIAGWVLVLSAPVASLVNSICLFNEEGYKWWVRVSWLGISLLPAVFIGVTMIMSFIR